MSERTVSRADARIIAEAAVDLADRAQIWKSRALKAEAALAFQTRTTAAQQKHPSGALISRAHRTANRIGSSGMWHASSGAGHGDSIVGQELADLIRQIIALATTPARNTSQIGEG
jgi:hypothetical protein